MKIFDIDQLSSGFPTKIVGIVGKLSEEILRVGDFGLRKIGTIEFPHTQFLQSPYIV